MPAVPPRLPRTRRTVTRNDTGHTDMPQGRQHRPHSSNQPIAVKTHAATRGSGSESEREELIRLREEVKHARMEAEFAKKVASWFAKDQR